MKKELLEETIEQHLDDKYRSYAYYVINNRAIPSIKDGQKIGNRRALWIGKDEAKELTKVNTLSGITVRIHPHGSTSVDGTISNMAQDFAGANNYPLFKGKGAFGNRLSGPGNGIGASRYVSVKVSDFAKKLMLVDMDLINIIPNYDGEFTEGETFLPIVPMILLNGVSGIAVGFATQIQPYKLEAVINIQKKIIKGEKLTQKDFILPWFKGFRGKVFIDTEGIIKCRGVYELKSKTELHITELPIGWNREQYVNYLDNLIEKGTIRNFINDSQEEFDFTIKLPNSFDISEENVIKVFKLDTNLNQNLNVIDVNNKFKTYDSILHIIEDFTNWRFGFYIKRYELLKKNLTDIMTYSKELLRFIQFVLEHDYLKKMSKMTRAVMVKELEGKFNFTDRLLSLPINNFNMEKIEELKKKIKEDEEQISEWTKIIGSEKLRRDIYVRELDNIKV